jgi:excisionase family DNA binding protein
VAQLREILRGEIQAAIGAPKGSTQANPYLTIPEAAQVAKLGPSTLRQHIAKGHLVANRVGRRVVISRANLEKFLQANPTGIA